MFLMLSDLSEQIAKDDADLVSPSFLRACGVFASELFANTQEHATSDHKGEPYLEHVEGIIVSWIQMDDSQFGQDFQGHARLSDFWRRELAPTRGGTAMGVRCLQLSFFDSGPGFASRSTGLTAEDMDIAHERAVMLKCLQKNVTTKRQSGAGQGLPDVLEELRATGGLIRIRSGRHCIFNSFSPGETRDLFDFADWTPGALSPVSGAVVSILIPLRRT
jgi:hypothetical protein